MSNTIAIKLFRFPNYKLCPLSHHYLESYGKMSSSYRALFVSCLDQGIRNEQ